MSTLSTKKLQLNREIMTFGLIGVLNTALDFIVLNVLISILHRQSGATLALADVVAFLVATSNSYLLNARFTFRQKHGNAAQIARFCAVTVIGLGINSVTVTVVAPQLSHFVSTFVALNASKLCATILSLGWNYFAMRRWVFQATPVPQPDRRIRTMPTSPLMHYRLRLVVLAATLAACISVIGVTLVQARLQSQISQLSTPYHRPHITGADWASAQMDTQHTGYNGHEVTLSTAMMPHLALNGAYSPTHAGVTVTSAAIAANGSLFFLSNDGYLYAVDANTSALQWKQFLGTPALAPKSPCVVASQPASILWSNGALYVGGGTGDFYALNAQSGAVAWKTTLVNATAESFADSPWVGEGHLYVSIIARGDCAHISGRVVLLDPATGALQAQFTAAQAGGSGTFPNVTPTFAPTLGGFLIAGNAAAASARLIAFGTQAPTKSSTVTKTATTSASSHATITVAAGSDPSAFGTSCLIMAAGTAGVACFDQNANLAMFNLTATGPQLRWQKQVSATKIVASVTDSHTLYVALAGAVISGTTVAGAIAAFEPLTGALLWLAPISTPGAPLTLVGANDFLVVGLGASDGTGGFAVIAMHDGKVVYSHALTAAIAGTAAIANGEINITTVDGHLYEFGAAAPLSPADTFAEALPNAQWLWVSQDAKHARQTQHGLQLDTLGKYNVDDVDFLTESLPQHDFSMTAQVSFAPKLLNEQAVITAYSGPGNYIKVGLIHKSAAKDQFELTAFVDGSAITTMQVDETVAPGTPVSLQIVRLGATYYGYVSNDGVIWQSLGEYTPPYIATLAGLSAFRASEGDLSTATFYACSLVGL